jgi:predicted MFS family arabinose efflux permease
VTLYTSFFSVGVGLSFLVSQVVADNFGWRSAFLVTGLGPLLMIAACVMMAPFKPQPSTGHPLDFRPVFRNRAALGYVFGYGAHCFELYGMRTWIVAFWTFVLARHADSALPGPVTVSVVVTLLSLPASVLGNEAALRYGRHRAIVLVMVASAVVAFAIGLSATIAPALVLLLLIIYGFTVPADSGALTSGMSASAVPMQRGATMALHSTVGFGLSALGAWGMGIALDVGGGPDTGSGWLAAFSLLAVAVLLGPLALWWSRRA